MRTFSVGSIYDREGYKIFIAYLATGRKKSRTIWPMPIIFSGSLSRLEFFLTVYCKQRAKCITS